MTKRNPVSAMQNVWFDAEQVDASDLNLEQNYNNSIQSAIINNQFGTGILVDALQDRILFNSDATIGLLDGTIIEAQNQPSDNNYGNQLEISLSESKTGGKRSVKIGIIGLDFQQNLQYETFYFRVNESQITKKHYTAVLQILINDFRGESNQSFNLGGKILIKEAKPYSLSRSASMVAQTTQPNLFFRDFFSSLYSSPLDLLRAGLPYYNIDNLNIRMAERDNKIINFNDVTTQIGQKFQAKTNNIQKITLLLAATNPDAVVDDYKWNGEIVVSVYPLQTALQCPTDIPPQTLIDYSPSPVPLAQISFSYDTLLAAGTQLNTVPQPVDFIFSNTALGGSYSIVPESYYAFTIKRSGAADKGNILISTGNKELSNSKLTVFNGTLWVDLVDEDLWFNIATDAAKVTDGQAYVSGNGVTLPKVTEDLNTGATVDYCLDNLYFSGADTFRGVVFAETEKNTPVQDLRTGNLIFSRQQNVPNVQLLSSLDIANLSQTTDPLLIGAIADKNIKFFDASSDANFNAKLYTFSFINNEIFIKIVEDPSDPKYDESVKFLQTQLLTGNLTKIKIFPDFSSSPSIYYRVATAEIISMLYGDVNGDGVVNDEDFNLINTYLGFNFNQTPPLHSTFNPDIVNNTVTFVNGYSSYQYPFGNATNIIFQVVNVENNKIIASGADGILVPDPSNPRQANFSSASVDFFNLSPAVGGNKLLIFNSGNAANNGGFDIIGIDSMLDILTIRKILLNSKSIPELFRSDLNEDYLVNAQDADLLNKYINKESFIPPVDPVFNKIGKPFNVIKLTLEKYQVSASSLDRNDDYFTSLATRNTDIHLLGDVFVDDALLQGRNISALPANLFFQKQFSWEDYLVVSNSKNKLVPTIFDNGQDTIIYSKDLNGIQVETYNMRPEFDPGRVDTFVPDNLIIGPGGEIVRENGDFYKIDFEVGTIILEIPPGMIGSERDINVFDDFVRDYNGNGITRLGFPAMRFADFSTVQSDALSKDQLRLSVSIQSFSPNTNGIDPNGIQGIIVDGKIGVSIDYASGIITLNFTNLYQDPVLSTLTTKVQINVFLKKGGFNNKPLYVDSTKVSNLMKLISIFSGPVVGGASALVDLETDVVGVLPILHGGTGLDAVGASGTVLMSNGASLSYQFAINSTSGVSDANKLIKTDSNGLLSPSFYYKNPVYIYGVSGYVQNSISNSQIIAAFPFSFNSFILQDIKDIRLEVVVQSFSGDVAQITMQDDGGDIYLDGNSFYLGDDTGTQFMLFKSKDLKSQLINYPSDSICVLRLNSSVSGNAICTMARLVITYNNPDNGIDFQSLPPV